jgi:hypothetical protein
MSYGPESSPRDASTPAPRPRPGDRGREPANETVRRHIHGGVRCGGCGTSYEHTAWLHLPIVGVLTSQAIAEHVVKWPSGARIEIRRCSRCARSIARTEGPAQER